ARLSLASGDRVEVGNASGRLLATAAVTDDIAPGVVCLHEGAWFDPGPDGVDRGGSANELSSTDGTGPASAPVMHGIPCALKKIRPTVP
ncbi:MAG TPA: molybdopterin dinucleotide binding domain-containing protein, partial [Spirochaetales bacterium]|nr:molybdopterin dinucleotide binding domain-containing protein [Spirochaetales bacterium]HPM72853.1 molybdopterin dinucleotide binding domain-containing protein [Spirochaetales bacterium]